MENYFSNFSLEDQNFMIDFLLSEGNISRMCKKGVKSIILCKILYNVLPVSH